MNKLCLLPTVVALLLSGSLAMAQSFQITDKLLSSKCSRERGSTPIEYLMIHFCSNVMEDSQKPYQLQKITDVFESYGVSAHYIIDRQGQIYRLVEESRVAYHAGKGQLPHPPFHKDDLNSRSIGIEIMAIGSAKDMKGYMNAEKYSQIPAEHIGYTDAQYKALNWLIQDISTRNQGIVRNRKHIIGHDEYAPERKNDPGELFDWNRLEGIK